VLFVANLIAEKEEEKLILKQLHVYDCKLLIDQQQDE
jgi:hypothetical protein